jgi:hypothetical protein
MKDEKIVLPPSQTEFLLKSLAAALDEAPPSVKDSILMDRASKWEQKRFQDDSGLIF